MAAFMKQCGRREIYPSGWIRMSGWPAPMQTGVRIRTGPGLPPKCKSPGSRCRQRGLVILLPRLCRCPGLLRRAEGRGRSMEYMGHTEARDIPISPARAVVGGDRRERSSI